MNGVKQTQHSVEEIVHQNCLVEFHVANSTWFSLVCAVQICFTKHKTQHNSYRFIGFNTSQTLGLFVLILLICVIIAVLYRVNKVKTQSLIS